MAHRIAVESNHRQLLDKLPHRFHSLKYEFDCKALLLSEQVIATVGELGSILACSVGISKPFYVWCHMGQVFRGVHAALSICVSGG